MERSPKRRRRGILQRQVAARSSAQEKSALHELLMTFLAQGLLSGALCHSIAVAAKKDMDRIKEDKELPDLDQLAGLKLSKSLLRSVYGNLKKSSNLPAPFPAEIPYKDATKPGYILLPHEYFAAMYENDSHWKTSVLGDSRKLEQFWTAFDKHPVMIDSPLKDIPEYTKTLIPLSLHGDEVPVFGVGKIWARSVLSFSWTSILANALGARAEDCTIYIWGVFEKFVAPDEGSILGTMSTFFSILRWSFQTLLDGVWPTHDWRGIKYTKKSPEGRKAGLPLAGGYRACLLQLCGDLDYFQKWFGIPQSTNHSKPCCQCKATFRGKTSWLDNRPGSRWQSLLLTNHNWTQHWQSTSQLFLLPGFTCWNVALDLMHNLYLGWLQFLYGSIMFLLVFQVLPDEPLANLKQIGAFIKTFQTGDDTRQKFRPRLDKLSMFQKAKGFPKLKGRAADIRGLDKAILACWDHHLDSDDPQHLQISALLQLNVEVRDVLDSFSPKMGYLALPDDVHAQVLPKCFQMVQLHVQLQDHYAATDLQIFNVTSKTHFCLHTMQLSNAIHPYLTWCFKGETKMKAVQRLWKSCLDANKHWAVAQVAALKNRHLQSLKHQR